MIELVEQGETHYRSHVLARCERDECRKLYRHSPVAVLDGQLGEVRLAATFCSSRCALIAALTFAWRQRL